MGRNVRQGWVDRNPPNHAGFYYCHLCGGWVHETEAELDHVIPKSVMVAQGRNPDSDSNLRMSHIFPQVDMAGNEVCIGNQKKGSTRVTSKTLEIAPPDEAL